MMFHHWCLNLYLSFWKVDDIARNSQKFTFNPTGKKGVSYINIGVPIMYTYNSGDPYVVFSAQTCEYLAVLCHGPLARYVKLRVAHAPGMPGTFSPPAQVSDPDMHQGTCVRHVVWCMPGSLTSGFHWNRWRGKRSWHSRRMRNL